jgi:tetratricopeptide repeat protein
MNTDVAAQAAVESPALRRSGALTFNKDVAPIIFKHCAVCHRPGQAGPFSLLSYDDVRKHAKLIAEVTQNRYMPPWLPEPGYGTFAGERRLAQGQIDVIQRWVAGGTVEGDPKDLPPPPDWSEGWLLGQPDLVVTMPRAYTLSAEGKDVYRNFVFPLPVSGRRYVKGVEFRPGNAKVVHHAFINVDETPFSRRLAEKENPPGFEGMVLPETSRMPGGHFLGWQPGKVPSMVPEGLAWLLNPGTDLVVQLHLHPSGKPEMIQPSIGFYFTDTPPTNQLVRINLSQLFIDIPAGATNYTIEQSYLLPVDVQVFGISPHTHYLGKELQGFALLPDGTRNWLLRIKDWDFNWQGDYRYQTPQFLPQGSRLQMRFSFDNSTNNVRNPRNPPQRVKYGLQTTDEMGELWFQVLPRDRADREVLLKDLYQQLARWSMEYNMHLVQLDPNDAVARTRLSRALLAVGKVSEALDQLHAAVRAKPDYHKAHYELGFIYLRQNRLAEAAAAFETVVRLTPDDYEAEGSLGTIYLQQGKLSEAQAHLENALKINPADNVARRNLELVLKAKKIRPQKP